MSTTGTSAKTYEGGSIDGAIACKPDRRSEPQVSNWRLSIWDAQVLRNLRIVFRSMSRHWSTIRPHRLPNSPIRFSFFYREPIYADSSSKSEKYQEPHGGHASLAMAEQEEGNLGKRGCTYLGTVVSPVRLSSPRMPPPPSNSAYSSHQKRAMIQKDHPSALALAHTSDRA